MMLRLSWFTVHLSHSIARLVGGTEKPPHSLLRCPCSGDNNHPRANSIPEHGIGTDARRSHLTTDSLHMAYEAAFSLRI